MEIRTLVVDDSETFRTMLRDQLEASNCRVDCVDSVVAARKRLASEQYDLVVVDHVLEEEYGLQLIRTHGKRVCIVLCSGVGEMHMAAKAMRMGAAGAIDKQRITWLFDEVQEAITYWKGQHG